ncbi:MAG: hypothetical protein ACJ79M_21080 [Myxococcales bacterium]
MSGEVSNQVDGPGWKSFRMVNGAVACLPFSSSQTASILPEPPARITTARPLTSTPAPKIAAFPGNGTGP